MHGRSECHPRTPITSITPITPITIRPHFTITSRTVSFDTSKTNTAAVERASEEPRIALLLLVSLPPFRQSAGIYQAPEIQQHGHWSVFDWDVGVWKVIGGLRRVYPDVGLSNGECREGHLLALIGMRCYSNMHVMCNLPPLPNHNRLC